MSKWKARTEHETCLICGELHGFLAMKSLRHAIMLSCLLLAFFYVMLCSQSMSLPEKP